MGVKFNISSNRVKAWVLFGCCLAISWGPSENEIKKCKVWCTFQLGVSRRCYLSGRLPPRTPRVRSRAPPPPVFTDRHVVNWIGKLKKYKNTRTSSRTRKEQEHQGSDRVLLLLLYLQTCSKPNRLSLVWRIDRLMSEKVMVVGTKPNKEVV